MSVALLKDPGVVTSYFSAHRPVRDIYADTKSVLFHLTRFASSREYVLLHANRHYAMRIFFSKPKDYEQRPYWRVYSAHWNQLAFPGEFNQENKYRLECYVDLIVGSGVAVGEIGPTPMLLDELFNIEYIPDIDEQCSDIALLNDCLSSLFEHMGALGDRIQGDKRVTHLICEHPPLGVNMHHCAEEPLQNHKRRVWEFF